MRSPSFKPINSRDGWMVSTYINGKRHRRFFKTREEAAAFGVEQAKQRREHGSNHQALPPVQHSLAMRAFELLGQLPPESILEAVRLYVEKTKKDAASIDFRDAVQSYVEARSHRTKKHLNDIARLTMRFSGRVSELTGEDIEHALKGMPPTSRNGTLRCLRSVLNYAVKKGWASVNAASAVENAHIPQPKIPILNAAQVQSLLLNAGDLTPLIAIEVFAGVRPAEAQKLRWEDIDFADGTLTIRPEVAKTRRVRHIAMHPTLIEWLAPYKATGRIASQAPFTLRMKLREIRANANLLPWGQDCARHTFASAALNSGFRDINGLTLELGHTSPTMLWKHYFKSLKKDDAENIFKVLPL